MKFLIIDTETTGLFDFSKPADGYGQPRMAQAGFIYLDHIDDEPRAEGHYIFPDGWEMSDEASRVNGLTTPFLRDYGIPVEDVLDLYEAAIDEGRVIVAFNAQFDCKVLRAEMRRAGRNDRFEQTKQVCVMRPLVPVLALPQRNGRGGHKFPNLAEACAHFGIVNERAHDALGDARAAMEILRHLHRLDLMPEPAVHYAKTKVS